MDQELREVGTLGVIPVPEEVCAGGLAWFGPQTNRVGIGTALQMGLLDRPSEEILQDGDNRIHKSHKALLEGIAQLLNG